jgi:predicted RND superfamily exporter protein
MILLLVLIYVDALLISGIKVQKIEWNAFLPQITTDKQATNVLLDKQKQYIFCHSSNKDEINTLKHATFIDECFSVPFIPDTYIFLFDATKMNTLLNATKKLQRSGTVLVGSMVFEEFYAEIYSYTVKIIPIVVLLLLFLMPLRLWIDILLEMAIYTLFLTLVLRLDFIQINAASLLSLLFLVIYSLTLINYLYSQGMNFKRLFLGIQISIVATMVSALFLIYSHFGLIHSFGTMLLLGLIVLHLYMNVRIYLTKYFRHSYHEHTFTRLLSHDFLKRHQRLIFAITLLVLGVAFTLHKNFSIDLNIVNILPQKSKEIEQISHFEKNYVASLPFVITIKTKKKNFADKEVIQKLLALQKNFTTDLNATILESFSLAFRKFKKSTKEKDNPNLLAQFLLANSFVTHDIEIFSPDMSTSVMVVVIPLTMNSDNIIALNKKILMLSKQYPIFDVTIKGKVADFDKYLAIFMQEFFIGLLATLFLSALFFLFYCKNFVSIFIIFGSVVFSLSMLVFMHLIFNKPLSLLTLMSIILYAGLIADSLIQLFICYKSSQIQCERAVLHPIFISNAAILIFLAGMLFVDGILHSFAFDMSILLASNLLFIVWVIPYIHKRYPKVCSDSKQTS